MLISLHFNEEDTILIKEYASIHNISVSELFRRAVLETIEDEYDLKTYNMAISEYQIDSKKYTLDEVENELGLS